MAPDALATRPMADMTAGLAADRIGIIANPGSHAYARHAAEITAARSRHPTLLHESPDTPVALAEALARFRRAGIGLIAVNGGDGTLRHVLTALPDAYPDHAPAIALLPAGNTNLAAWSLGSAGSGAAALTGLLSAARAGRLRRTLCPVLEVDWIGQTDRAKLRGLLLGAAAFPDAKRIADRAVHRRGFHRRPAVGLTLMLTFLRTVLGGHALRSGMPLAVGIDGQAMRSGRHFLVLATTLDRLTLGLWPFWGNGTGAIRWLDIDAPPPRLGAALLAILLRRPGAWMEAAGYRSGRAEHIHLALREFVLDGEFFDGGPDGVRLSCPGSVSFVRP